MFIGPLTKLVVYIAYGRDYLRGAMKYIDKPLDDTLQVRLASVSFGGSGFAIGGGAVYEEVLL